MSVANRSKSRYIGALVFTLAVGMFLFKTITGYLMNSSENVQSDQTGLESEKAKPTSSQSSVSVSDSRKHGSGGNKTTNKMVTEGLGLNDISSLLLKDLWTFYRRPGTLGQEERSLASKLISQQLSEYKNGAIDVQSDIASYIKNETEDERERIGLARILGESNTPEALGALTDALFITRSSLLQRSILEQLDRMGTRQSPEQVESMAKVAQDVWLKTSQRQEMAVALYPALAGILARLGNPAGVDFLRNQALDGGTTITELSMSNRDSSMAAMNASLKVRGTESLSLLTSALRMNDPQSIGFVWSGQALVSIGRPEATTALIEWSKTAPDSCAETAADWLGAVRDSRSHALVLEFATNGEKLHFASSRVKNLVLASANRLTTK